MARIEFHRESNDSQRGGDLAIEFGRPRPLADGLRPRHPHRLRAAAYYGAPPGSHIGLWRTRYGGHLRGINLRIGRRYIGPTLTLFVHWR